jgi:DnaJ-class molecular chaperone
MNRTVPCPHCHGKGKLAAERGRNGWPTSWKPCGLCHGKGWLPDPDDNVPHAA